MASGVFNIAKGRTGELYNRVKSNDPANSAFVAIPLLAAGLVGDSTMVDYASFAAITAGASDEAAFTNYRKVLTDSDLASFPSPDNTNDRYDYPLPILTWLSVSASGGNWGKLIVCYDADTTGGTDANLLPLTYHDFAATVNGLDIVGTPNAAGFYRAS